MHVKQESLPRGRMTLRTDENANRIHLCTKGRKLVCCKLGTSHDVKPGWSISVETSTKRCTNVIMSHGSSVSCLDGCTVTRLFFGKYHFDFYKSQFLWPKMLFACGHQAETHEKKWCKKISKMFYLCNSAHGLRILDS